MSDKIRHFAILSSFSRSSALVRRLEHLVSWLSLLKSVIHIARVLEVFLYRLRLILRVY